MCFQYTPTIYLARNQVLTKFDFLPSISLVYIGNTYFDECKSTILDRPKILFTEIQAQINLFSGTNELRTLQQNCYFAHRENLLSAMLGDEDKTIRPKAVNVIQKIRNGENENQEGEQDPVREFH